MPGNGGRLRVHGPTSPGRKRMATSNAGNCHPNAPSAARSATRLHFSTVASRNARWTTGRARPAVSKWNAITTARAYFRFDVAPEKASDVWRTTWDRRIVVPPGGGNVLAYAQRADGSLQAFGADGRELQNNQGGASALLQRLTDAAGAATGWRLTTANSDVETYDAAGRLLSVALRVGPTYTLAYLAERSARHRYRRVWRHPDVHLRRVGPPRRLRGAGQSCCTSMVTTPPAD